MNYKQMLDKFKELESRLKAAENTVRSLEHRIINMEKPGFTPSWPANPYDPPQPQWPKEFWPTIYTRTTTGTKK